TALRRTASAHPRSRPVSRRPKPATHEHLKTSHFEETRIGRVGSLAVSAEGDPTWRIDSRWHSSRPFSPCIGGAGRSGALPGNWTSTARRWLGTFERPPAGQNQPKRLSARSWPTAIQNQPKRPSAPKRLPRKRRP